MLGRIHATSYLPVRTSYKCLTPVVVAWMVLWILANAHRLPVYYVSLALFGFGTLTTMNVSMLVKLVQRDFLGRPDSMEVEEKGHAANGVTAATALVNKQD